MATVLNPPVVASPAASLFRRLAANTGWSVIGSAAAQGSSLIGTIILGNLLGLTAFGKLSLVLSTVLTLQVFAEFGLGLTTTKFVARLRTTNPAKAGRAIGFALRSAAMSGIFFATVLALAGNHVPGLRIIGAELLLAPALLACELINRIQMSALAGLESFHLSARAHVCRCLLTPEQYHFRTSRGLLEPARDRNGIHRRRCSRRRIRKR